MQCPRLIAIHLCFVVCAPFATAARVSASEVPILRAPLSASHLREETVHFDVFIAGKKVGWMRQSMLRREFAGEDVYAFEMEFMQKLLNSGEALTIESIDIEYFSAEPPYRFVAASSKTMQNGFESATHIGRAKLGRDGFTARIRSGRVEREKAIGDLDYTLGDLLGCVVWCESQPAVGDCVRLRELDFADLEVRTAVHTLRRVLPTSGDGALLRGGRIGKYEIDYFDEIGKTRAKLISDAHGQLLGGKIGGSVELKLTTAEQARTLVADLDLFESSLIKLEFPLGDASRISAMELEITGASVAAIVDSPEQDADIDPAGERLTLKVGRRHGKRIPVTPEEREKALEETSAYPTKDPQVIALTERAIGSAERPKTRIKRLVGFVDKFITDDTGNEPLTVNDIIDTQRGDCTEHSQLFVTMARAAGIPAREVSGFIYGEAPGPSFGGHAWCEVEVDGYWHSVDPSWGETVVNATHIRISSDRPSSEEMDIYLGGLKFQILSVTDRDGTVRQFPQASE